MKLKIQKIGNSLGVILPKETLDALGYHQGDFIEINICDDPFWAQIKSNAKKLKKQKNESIDADDLGEWENL